MLSPRDLEQVVRLDNALEAQNKIEAIALEALRALEHSARQGHPDLAGQLRPEVAALTRSDLVGVRTEAAALLKHLPDSP